MRIELVVSAHGVSVTRLVPESVTHTLREQIVGGAVLAELGPALEALGVAARRADASAVRRPAQTPGRPATRLRAVPGG